MPFSAVTTKEAVPLKMSTDSPLAGETVALSLTVIFGSIEVVPLGRRMVISVPLIVLFLLFRDKIMEGVSRGGTKG